MGQDVYGNKFFESDMKNPLGKKTRILTPPKEVDMLNMISPEWDAWLRLVLQFSNLKLTHVFFFRHRRVDPPSYEEVTQNLENAKIRKEKADQRFREMLKQNKSYAPRVREIRRKQDEREMHNPFNPSYPSYPDMENVPGAKKKDEDS